MKHRAKIAGIIRHLLTFGGGMAVTMGFLDEEAAASIQTEQFVGGLATLIGLIWSIFSPAKKVGKGDPE